MIKLIKTQSTDPRIENTQGPKRKVPLIPILKDLHHIELLSSIHIKVLNPDEPHEFELTITPEEKSVWYGGSYVFDFLIPENYPMEPPKYKCKTKVIEILVFEILDLSS